MALGLVAAATGLSVAAPEPSDVEAAEQRLMELEKEFELVVEEYNLVHERLLSTQAEIGATELEVGRIRERMAGKQKAALALARELYMAGPSVALESVLSAGSLAEFDVRLKYLSTTEEAQTRVFERLLADQSALEESLEVLETERAEAQAAEQQLASLRAEIQTKVAAQRDEIAELNAAIARADRREAARERAAAQAAIDAARAAASEPVQPRPPAPAAGAPVEVASGTPAASASAQTAVDAALSQVGKPYQWGAAGPDSYDCSGLTMWAWARAGVSLPHNSGAQYDATPRVSRSEWQPGDLLFFGSPIHHVAMYIGRGQMVEAPYSGNQVRVVSASRSDYVGAGRPGV